MRATTNHNREVGADIVSASRQKIKEDYTKNDRQQYKEIFGNYRGG